MEHSVERETVIHTLCAIQCKCGKGFFGVDVDQARAKHGEHVEPRSAPPPREENRDDKGRYMVPA